MRLGELLAYAKEHCAYYAQLPLGFEPLSEVDAAALLARLPLLDRNTAQRHRAQLLAIRQDSRRWRVTRTTGTTGEPLEIFVDEQGQALELEVLLQQVDRCVGARPHSFDVMHLTLHPGASSRAVVAGAERVRALIKWNLCRLWQLDDVAFARGLAHVEGAVVTALPSMLALLTSRLQEFRADLPRPLLIVLSGEEITDELVDAARRLFRCPVTSAYILAEAGIVGTACAGGGYHVEDACACVEITDGEIVVTPLSNTATVLIRYRTGDRGEWAGDCCGCGHPGRRFRVLRGRRPRWLNDDTGRAVNVVRFAKVLSQFDVDQIKIGQHEADAVEVSYHGAPLDVPSRRVLEDAMLCALGPTVRIEFNWIATPLSSTTPRAAIEKTEPLARPPEAVGPDLSRIASWLSGALAREEEVLFAAIFGSATEPEATTRFSDIDLLLLVRGDRFDPRWGPVAQRLRRSVPNLSVHVDNMTSLRRRAPLMVCRLLGEYHLVIRDAASEKLIWPEHQWLCDEARYWSQTAVMALANRMAHLENGGDPLRDAWFASKTALTAMRFRQLKRGGRSTHWRTILQSASEDVERMHMVVPTIIEALEIAREHRPPPPSKAGESSRFLAAALECVACAQGDYGAGGGH